MSLMHPPTMVSIFWRVWENMIQAVFLMNKYIIETNHAVPNNTYVQIMQST